MTSKDMQELEELAIDIDNMCDMLMRRAEVLASEYIRTRHGEPNALLEKEVLATIKVRLAMKLEKEIFNHDN